MSLCLSDILPDVFRMQCATTVVYVPTIGMNMQIFRFNAASTEQFWGRRCCRSIGAIDEYAHALHCRSVNVRQQPIDIVFAQLRITGDYVAAVLSGLPMFTREFADVRE